MEFTQAWLRVFSEVAVYEQIFFFWVFAEFDCRGLEPVQVLTKPTSGTRQTEVCLASSIASPFLWEVESTTKERITRPLGEPSPLFKLRAVRLLYNVP